MCNRCELLKRFWVLSFLLVVLVGVVASHGESEESRSFRSSLSHQEVDGGERSQNVRAKWKGEQFWASVAPSLTQLEQQKTLEVSSGIHRARSSLALNQKKSSSSRAKKGRSKSKKGSSHRHRPRSASKIAVTSSPTTHSSSQTALVPEHKSSIISRNTSEGLTSTTAGTTASAGEPVQQISPALSVETKASTSTNGPSRVKPTTEPLDRSTLIADLGPYQDFYLEYESNEEDDPPPTTTKTTTEMSTPLTTEPPNTNSSNLKITFLPKTPVNLLYLLQAYASNMKPIELQSPIPGGPSATISPSIPIRVPVELNPPNSPFLFNLDLDNFFTRMAISFFYSSIAIAPMIYLLLNSIGSLAGLNIVPFTGRRKKRNTPPQEIFENKDIEGLVDQVMTLFDFFMHGDPDEQFQEERNDNSKEMINPLHKLDERHQTVLHPGGFPQSFFEIPNQMTKKLLS